MRIIIRSFFTNPRVNRALSIALLVGIALTGAEILYAATPDPGHNFSAVGGGAVLGDVLYGSAADTVSSLAGNITTTKKFLRSTGNGSAATAPTWDTLVAGDIPDISATYSAKAGNTGLVTAGTLTTGALGSGFTAVADAQISSAATWNAKLTNPLTTLGDVMYGGASGVATRLAGSAGFLKSTGAVAPAWSTINLAASADVGTSIVPVANGGTNLAAAVSDAVLVGDSTSAYTARTLPASCAGTTAKLLYDSTTNLFSCGTDQTSAGGTTYVVTTADVASTASNAYQNITNLSWTLAASTRYDIECHILYAASATTIGIGIGWTGPASPLLTTGQMTAGLTTATIGGTTSVGNDTGLYTSASVATTNNHARFEGFWSNGTNGGTLQMRFRPETATANGIVIKAGSWCKYSTY